MKEYKIYLITCKTLKKTYIKMLEADSMESARATANVRYGKPNHFIGVEA
jgi:hypothetical protein